MLGFTLQINITLVTRTTVGVSTRSLRIVVAVNDRGRRIGETHHNSQISDEVVDQMRARHEDDGIGYRKIAREFNVALTTVRKICSYERRAQTAERWKTIKVRHAQPAHSVPVTSQPPRTREQATYEEGPRHFCGSQ